MTGSDRDRNRSHARGDHRIAFSGEVHIGLGDNGAVAQDGVHATCKRIDRHRTGPRHRNAGLADSHGHRCGHRERIEVAACDLDVVAHHLQHVGIAEPIAHHPAAPGLKHRDVELGPYPLPVLGIGIVGAPQVVLHPVLADVAVNGTTLAALAVVVDELDRVATFKALVVGADNFPAAGVVEIELGEVGFPIGRADVLINQSSEGAGDDPHLVALVELLRAIGGGVVPLQTIGTAVQRRRPKEVGIGEIHALVSHPLRERLCDGGIGIVGSKLPARGVGKVLFPELDACLNLYRFPEILVLEVGIAQVDRVARPQVLEELAHQIAIVMVARHPDHVAGGHHTPPDLSGVTFGLTNKPVDAVRKAARGMKRVDTDRVTRLDLHRRGRDRFPAAVGIEIDVRSKVDERPAAIKLIDPAI